MKLISMVAFVKEQKDVKDSNGETNCCTYSGKVIRYAELLDQKLTLGMFIPCDLDGNVLKEPIKERAKVSQAFYDQEKKQYQQAKERVLFKGFEIGYYGDKPNTIEFDDIILHFSEMKDYKVESIYGHPTLTEQAQKQIGI